MQLVSQKLHFKKGNVNAKNLSNIKSDDFSVGIHFGAGINIKRMEIDLRYD